MIALFFHNVLILTTTTNTSRSHLGRVCCYFHGREWAHLLRVLLTMQCPLQTSPITPLRVHYIHTAVPHLCPASCYCVFLIFYLCFNFQEIAMPNAKYYAVQCPLWTSPITQAWACYIHTVMPHALHCTV